MSGTSNIVYLYDGTFEGFLCCVFESFYAHEMPCEILPEYDVQPTFFVQKYIETNSVKAGRVHASFSMKICPDAQKLMEDVFCSCIAQRELHMLRFLRFAFKNGAVVMNLPGHALVAPVFAAQRFVEREAHSMIEFLRFSEHGDVLVATIEPKSFVLPYIYQHFCSRFMNENFLIFDKTHQTAFVWHNKQARMLDMDEISLPPQSPDEEAFQMLWKRFYDTIAIPERMNERCRMNHCPKRYWAHMLEMQSALLAKPHHPALP